MNHGKKLVQILTGLCCRKHRHWGLLAAKQSEPVIMLCMETMRISNADMTRGFCYILWPQNLIQVVWGDPVMLCNYIYAGMAELWRHQFVLKYMPCSFWKLPPSNQFKIIWNKSLLVCPTLHPHLSAGNSLLSHFKGKGMTLPRSQSCSVAHSISVTVKLLVRTWDLFHL